MPRSLVTPPSLPAKACLLLDFDGTLIDFAPDPASIEVPPGLVPLLAALSERVDGALAMVTGRTLSDLDHHLSPLQLPAATLHGTLRRDGRGTLLADVAATTTFADHSERIREQLQRLADSHPGVLLEDKDHALALHFRRADPPWVPDGESVAALAALLPAGLEILRGDHVIEVRPGGRDKGTAVEAFLAEPPFAGRVPIYLGDDTADLPAMAAVTRLGGVAIAVGDRIAAPWRLPNPALARSWLARQLLGSKGA